MNFNAFTTLWRHRLQKYSYILKQYLSAAKTITRFLWVKISYLGQKKLVLIIRTEHFGDIVAAEPIARQVRELHPNAYLIWLVRPVFRELIQTHPAIDKAWEQSSVLARALVCESGIFNTIYNLEFWQSNFDAISGKIHHNAVAAKKDITVFNYLDKGNLLTCFQHCANLPIKDYAPQLHISQADCRKIKALALPEKLIVVHCSSNYPTKDWAVPHWEQLILWLIEKKGFQVVEVGLKSNNNTTHPHFYDFCGQFSILQTAEIIRYARFFIGIDSGPAHLANAVGTFGVLLFGKLNNFDNYMPFSGNYQNGTNARIISLPNKTCAELDYAFVKTEIEKTIDTKTKNTLV